MNTDAVLRLLDGRNLCDAEFGAADDLPVLFFHGAPSSRMEPLLVGDGVWTRHGLRIIAPDPPGVVVLFREPTEDLHELEVDGEAESQGSSPRIAIQIVDD